MPRSPTYPFLIGFFKTKIFIPVLSLTCLPHVLHININKNMDQTLQVHNFYCQLFPEELHNPTQNPYSQLQHTDTLHSKLWSVGSMHVCSFLLVFISFLMTMKVSQITQTEWLDHSKQRKWKNMDGTVSGITENINVAFVWRKSKKTLVKVSAEVRTWHIQNTC